MGEDERDKEQLAPGPDQEFDDQQPETGAEFDELAERLKQQEA
jgi:hypothetical protein